MLANKLNQPTGFKLAAKQGNNGAIQFNLNSKADPKIGNEGYTLGKLSQRELLLLPISRPVFFMECKRLLQLFPKEIESKSAAKARLDSSGS